LYSAVLKQLFYIILTPKPTNTINIIFGGVFMDLKNSETLSDWDKWKKTLSKSVGLGEMVGLSEDTISNLGVKVGNFLSASVDPENREQRVLQELWKAGDDGDRKALSKMITKMVQNDND